MGRGNFLVEADRPANLPQMRRAGRRGQPGEPLLSTTSARASTGSSGSFPIKRIVVDRPENRSFDHYYGYAPFAGPSGVPPRYSLPEGQGGFVMPYPRFHGNPLGPSAPPRADRAESRNLLECFQF
jgi:phospholipase C